MRWIKKACSQPKTATTTCSAAGELQDCVSGLATATKVLSPF